MNVEGLLVFGILAMIALGVILFGLAFVYFGNRAIGSHYAEKAQRLLQLAQQEGVLYAENGVATRSTWRAPLAVGLRWPTVDIRVTTAALYLLQRQKMLGFWMSQPVLAAARYGDALSPLVREVTMQIHLGPPPRLENGAVVLEGQLGVQSFTTRLFPRDPVALMNALVAPGSIRRA